MNKTLIICALLKVILSSGLYAQDAKKVTYADKKQIEDFFNSKTMVVMDADPFIGYNLVVPDAVKKNWTITPFEIISSDQFDKSRTDPKLSFIFLSKVRLEKDKKEVYYLYMNIVMGAKVKDITDLPELLSLPLAYTGVDEEDYVDKLPLMIRFAQVHLDNLKTAKNPRLLYNLNNLGAEAQKQKDQTLSQLVKEKTLLVKESDLSEQVNTLEKIQKEYSGTVKIVTSEEMVKAIEEKTPNIAVLHQINPAEDENKGRSYCQIFGTDDARLYYYNYQTISQKRPAGMLARDFRLMSGKMF
jgi:hypothetical protein